MFYVYILRLTSGKYYTGQTRHLANRIVRHQTGQVRSTKGYRPVKLIYYETFASRAEAMRRESYLKSLKSHKWLDRIIDFDDGPIV